MRLLASFAAICAMSMAGCGLHPTWAQNYPSRPVRILTAEPGGVTDFAARLIAQGMTISLGQQVIVENRGVTSSAESAAKATPDGYSLLALGSSVWIGPLMQKMPYDPVKDFSPITLTTTSPNILVVHPAVPVTSIRELITLAKARPGELNYASATIGSISHLGGELFKVMAGVNIIRIAYKGTGQALNDVIGGQVQLMFPNAGSGLPHVKSGRLRALAVTSATPSALLPDLPTVAASGVPGYEASSMTAMFAPARTPDALIKRLNQQITRIVSGADVKKKLLDSGVEPAAGPPEQLASTVKSEMARFGKLIKDARIRDEY